MSAPADEGVHAGGEGFTDAVTISWADPDRGWFGMARLGLTAGAGSALAVVFRGREPVGALAQGALEPPAGADWTAFSLGAVRTTVEVPLERWSVAWDGEDQGFELALEAISAPVAREAGLAGYEQLVRVRGTARAGAETAEVDGLGQRGHAWGVVDWSDLELVRSVSAWLGEDHRGGMIAESHRPDGAAGHDAEAIWATLVEHGEPVPVHEPRLSTTYDAYGHQRRAGLELWLTEEEGYPVRVAGEVICGSSLELGALRLDLAFFRWHSAGAEGVGRYDVLRKVASG
ncbi:MAG: hypothetical protein ACR2NB_14245 [Solirubrobacteraceae bacterium]